MSGNIKYIICVYIIKPDWSLYVNKKPSWLYGMYIGTVK